MYIYSIIFMTNKSVMTFFYVNKYLSIYDIFQRSSQALFNIGPAIISSPSLSEIWDFKGLPGAYYPWCTALSPI